MASGFNGFSFCLYADFVILCILLLLERKALTDVDRRLLVKLLSLESSLTSGTSNALMSQLIRMLVFGRW